MDDERLEGDASGPTILLLPQNDQHLETTRILLPALLDAGLVPELLLMDGVFHQGLDVSNLRGVRVRNLDLSLSRPFYLLDPARQVVAVVRAIRPMRRALGRPRVILMFNDGAMQRLAMRLAPRARVAIVIDGIISDYARQPGLRSRSRSLLKRLGASVRSTWPGIVMPSDVGLSPVDLVFVLGSHSAAVLRRMGSKAGRILATGLPRWPEPAGERPASVRRVLYLTGAFAWHADHAADRAQVSDAVMIRDACLELGLELIVRVHPRDDVERWRARGFAVVTSRDEPMEACLRNADLVLAMVSTGLLEAIGQRRIARAVIMSQPFQRYAQSFVADPFLAAIRGPEQLRAALAAYREGIPAEEYAFQEHGLGPYVAGSGRAAAEQIARAVAELAR